MDTAAPAQREDAPLQAAPLTGIRRLSAQDTVRARIALAVDLGLLEPGERLPGNDSVASALDVSLITVRRALVSLCEDGVLERRRGRSGGTFVAPRPEKGAVREISAYTADAETVHRLIDQRLLLECGAAHLAARAGGPVRTARLRELVDAMDEARTWADFHELDADFHREVAAASGVPHAREELGAVLTRLHRYFLPYRMDVLRASNAEHRELLGAIEAADADRAVRVAHRHADTLHRTMFVGLDPEPPGH